MKYSLVIVLFFTISCVRYVQPNLYELDINDPLYERKALHNQLEIQRATEQSLRQQTLLKWLSQ
ncbi:MAG: hypothetical protein ACRCWI_03185 [Brevinema sp.]